MVRALTKPGGQCFPRGFAFGVVKAVEKALPTPELVIFSTRNPTQPVAEQLPTHIVTTTGPPSSIPPTISNGEVVAASKNQRRLQELGTGPYGNETSGAEKKTPSSMGPRIKALIIPRGRYSKLRPHRHWCSRSSLAVPKPKEKLSWLLSVPWSFTFNGMLLQILQLNCIIINCIPNTCPCQTSSSTLQHRQNVALKLLRVGPNLAKLSSTKSQ